MSTIHSFSEQSESSSVKQSSPSKSSLKSIGRSESSSKLHGMTKVEFVAPPPETEQDLKELHEEAEGGRPPLKARIQPSAKVALVFFVCMVDLDLPGWECPSTSPGL